MVCGGGVFAGDDYDVPAGLEPGEVVCAGGFFELAFDAVACYGVADFFADGEAETGVGVVCLVGYEYECWVCAVFALVVCGREVFGFSQPMLFLHFFGWGAALDGDCCG